MKRDSGQQHLATHAVRELALRFRSAADDGEAQARMAGILSLPDAPGPRGVLIVTGGPQYRIGSHRQFVLLARAQAAILTAVLVLEHALELRAHGQQFPGWRLRWHKQHRPQQRQGQQAPPRSAHQPTMRKE